RRRRPNPQELRATKSRRDSSHRTRYRARPPPRSVHRAQNETRSLEERVLLRTLCSYAITLPSRGEGADRAGGDAATKTADPPPPLRGRAGVGGDVGASDAPDESPEPPPREFARPRVEPPPAGPDALHPASTSRGWGGKTRYGEGLSKRSQRRRNRLL